MTGPHQGGRVRLGGRTAAFDRMIAAASAVAAAVLTDPIGAARIPETAAAPRRRHQGGPMIPTMLLRFHLGECLITPAARDLLAAAGVAEGALLTRHATGDWGDICSDDARENEFSLIHGFCIMSRYPVGGDHVYVITEADRSATTLLLTHEY